MIVVGLAGGRIDPHCTQYAFIFTYFSSLLNTIAKQATVSSSHLLTLLLTGEHFELDLAPGVASSPT